MILVSAGLAAFIYFLTPMIVKFLGGEELLMAIPVTRILTLWMLFVGISYYTGTPTLVAMGYSKPFNYSVIYSTVVLLLLYGIFYIAGIFTVISFAFALVAAEFFVAAYRIYFCNKYRLFSLKEQIDNI